MPDYRTDNLFDVYLQIATLTGCLYYNLYDKACIDASNGPLMPCLICRTFDKWSKWKEEA